MAAAEPGWLWVQARVFHSPLHHETQGNNPLVFELWYRPDGQTETAAPWGRHHPSTCHKGDEGRGDDLWFLEVRRRSPDLGYTSACEETRGWLSRSEHPLWHHLGDQLRGGEPEPALRAQLGRLQTLQVCRSELLLRKGPVGLRGEKSRGLPLLPRPAGSGQSIVQPGFQT